MCLIINFKPEFTISQDLMLNFAKRNTDGFGMMWIQDNRMCHMKFGPDKMGDLYTMYESVKNYEGFIHLRMRTHGNTNQEMAHPFNCGYGIYLMHNGIISDSTGEDKSKSDTWYFVNGILMPLFNMSKNPHKLIRSAPFSDLVHKYLGYNNRVVIGDRGGYLLFNKNAWYTIKEEATGCKDMLVSNQYAWDEQAFRPKKSYYGHHTSTPTTYNAGWKKTYGAYGLDEDESECLPGPAVPEKRATQSSFLIPGPTPEAVATFLNSHFFQIRKNWYADAYGKLYFKRLDNGLDRRADMDDNAPFWNSLPDDITTSYGEWVSNMHNLDLDTTKTVAPENRKRSKKKKIEPKASQLVLNWQNQSPDQIKEDLKAYPDRAAEAIVALTHEPLHQVN